MIWPNTSGNGLSKFGSFEVGSMSTDIGPNTGLGNGGHTRSLKF